MDLDVRNRETQKMERDVGSGREEVGVDRDEEDGEANSLLQPPTVGGSRTADSRRDAGRKVQWKDRDGYNLAEILEFEPSESSDIEDDDVDENDADSCPCAIM